MLGRIRSLASLLPSRRPPRRGSAAVRHSTLEPLERRVLMAGDLSVLYADGVLTVSGTDGADRICVTPDYADAGRTRLAFTLNDAPALTVDLLDYEALGAVSEVRVDGGAGNDRLETADGAGRFAGRLALLGGEGDDYLVGSAGPDRLDGCAGNDTLVGTAGDDVLLGGDGNDLLLGDWGADQLAGGAGMDRLLGGEGDDLLDGGEGLDRFFLSDGGANTVASPDADPEAFAAVYVWGTTLQINGTAGDDVVEMRRDPADRDRTLLVTVNGVTTPVPLAGLTEYCYDPRGGSDQVVHVREYPDLPVYLSGSVAGPNVTVSDLLLDASAEAPAPELPPPPAPAPIDPVPVDPPADTPLIEPAALPVELRDGYLVFSAGPTSDTVNVRPLADGADRALVEANGVVYVVDLSAYAPDAGLWIDAGGGDDRVMIEGRPFGGWRRVVVDGGPGDDLLVGGPGPDVLYGGLGRDHLRGEGGDDLLFGMEGDDDLVGGAGDDQLVGGAGADLLLGQAGRDLLDGGQGFDLYPERPKSPDAIGDRRRENPRRQPRPKKARRLASVTVDVLSGSAWAL